MNVGNTLKLASRKTNNPFLEAASRAWDERYADHVLAKRNWQIAAGCSTLLNAILVIGLVLLSLEKKIVPYVVEVDRAGYSVAVKSAAEAPLPHENVLRTQLAQFIRKVRSVSIDPTAMKSNFDDVYKGFLRGSAIEFLNTHFKENDPFKVARDQTITVERPSILRISEKTWQLRWREVTRTLDGYVVSREEWEAHVVTEIDSPTTQEEILLNPTGLRVVQISWTKSL